MTDTERLFDDLLNEAASGKRTPAECITLCQEEYPELVSSLKFALVLRSTSFEGTDTEAESARANIWHTLDALLDQEYEAPVPVRNGRSQPLPLRRQKPPWLVAALCAAILAMILVGNVTLQSASANALPGSPLYAVKRADEDMQLRLAWSNAMRADVLSMIATRRLAEARSEAALHNTSQALALMGECNDATRQLIRLAIAMHNAHQNDSDVIHALNRTLQAEYDAIDQAQSSGQAALVQVLTNNIADQQNALSASNIQIPPLITPAPNEPTQAVPSVPAPHITPTPHLVPTPSTVPHPTPGGNGSGNQGSGSDNSNGNGNSNSNGAGASNGDAHSTS